LNKKAPNLILYDTTSNVEEIDGKLTLTKGRTFDMYSIKSKYLVLFFWDPDCGHCKHEIPILVDTFNLVLKDMGVNVLAICLEHDTKKWKTFINEKKMNFIHGFDPTNYNNLYKTYDIYSTPVIYLLDENKKIIAKRLGVEQIKDVIKAYEENKRKEEK